MKYIIYICKTIIKQYQMAKLKTKNIDLSPECIEFHTIEAVKKKTVFKLHVQEILENLAKKKTKH